MAIYHFSVQVISRADGRSAVAAAAYRAAEKIADQRTGTVADFTKKNGVASTHILLPADAPADYADRSTLWNAVERAETRSNSQVAREIDIALPVELSPHQQRDLILGFVQQVFVDAGMCADVAIHDIYSGNPHAHVMLTTRNVDRTGFTTKNRDWNDKKLLTQWREQWAEHANNALEQAGHAERIDHRTLAAQGITDREPTVHLGPARHAMKRRGVTLTSVAPQLERQRLRRAAHDAAAAKVAEAEAQAAFDAQSLAWQSLQQEKEVFYAEAIRVLESAVSGEQAAHGELEKQLGAVQADTSRGEAAVRRLERRSEKLREEKQELERARAIAAAVTRAATRALGAVTGGLAQWRDRRAAQRRAEAHAERLRAELEREKERHEKAERVLRELEDWSGEAAGNIERLAEQLAAEESRHSELRADCERLEKMAATDSQRKEITAMAEQIRTARARSGVRMSSADALATAKHRYEQRHAAVQQRPRPTTPAPTQYDTPKG